MRLSTLYPDGNFYKGNFHTHTTNSDGRYDPKTVIRRYKAAGYSFLALTDHYYYGRHEEYTTKDFLMFCGVEFDTTYAYAGDKTDHLVAIGCPQDSTYPEGHRFEGLRGRPAQLIVNEMTANHHSVIYAHPYWSCVDVNDILKIKNTLGIEIYNNTCEMLWHSGSSEVYYDQLLWQGRRALCFASDDLHGRQLGDFAGGYIMVKARELTHQAIMQAILDGSFYSASGYLGTEGPQIQDFWIEGGIAHFTTSACRSLYLYTPMRGLAAVHGTPEKPVDKLQCRIDPEKPYVKACCVDFAGHVAWTQPIWLR